MKLLDAYRRSSLFGITTLVRLLLTTCSTRISGNALNNSFGMCFRLLFKNATCCSFDDGALNSIVFRPSCTTFR
uniref:Putative secreted protein n=1 Tax=Anopheles darlingi TaxID=43151 RepID=A0A2M4D5C9_ANODA